MSDPGLILSTLAKRRQLAGHERWSRPALAAHQAQALKALRDHAYAHSPFYRAFHRGLETAPLEALPTLTKARMMQRFDEVVTDRAIRLADVKPFVAERDPGARYLGRYWITSTSGTSGHPGLFLLDRDEWTLELATAMRAFDWAGLRLGLTRRTRVAQITSTNPSHLSTQGGRSMANWWMPTLILDASEPLASVVERLNAWRPEMLWAYASIIHVLAEEQLAGRLRIAPRSVLSASELLSDGVRTRARAAWGEVLFDTYATTDCGGVGAECSEHKGLHLMDDLAIFEVVDGDNRPAPPGTFGAKLLATVFSRRTQPLIRYELDDSVRLAAEACPCGRPFRLIDAIQGRIEEVLAFATPAGGRVDLHPIVFANIMDQLPVSAWQVLQDAAGLHLLLAGASAALDGRALALEVGEALQAHGAARPAIDVQRLVTIPKSTSGKTPLVRSALPRG
jgi:putative adenylate-forming enzyme